MIKRASTTLVICALSAGVAVVGLSRSATDASTAATPAAVEAAAAENAERAYIRTSESNGQTTETAASDSPAVVTIEGFAFHGTTVARAGETLTINNLDNAPHTFTASNGAFDSGTVQGGASGTLTLPTEPGTYEFFCAIHPSMTGVITVEG